MLTIITSKLICLDKKQCHFLQWSQYTNEKFKCFILQNLGGIKISNKSESFFVDLKVSFGEIQQFQPQLAPHL